MTLAPGTRLGSYEVLAPLGKGGMGEVWRARDGKLGREVALKTLPAEFAADPERLARFRREAQLLASLNHPNIGGIHGLEEADGTTALVLELVEGETLADRLHAPLAPRDALGLALQICTALESAHEKGVVHRDLKPANIKITPDGTVKVLDFGLAKAFQGTSADASAALTNSPTLSMAATQAGIILGTAAYMSPEQASGGATDRRSDIWSFGVVLFEMLTGKPVFGGETVPHVLAAVLAKDPPWERLPANLNPRLREVLERCLAKNVGDRYRDIGDVRADLRRVLDDPAGVIMQPAAVAPAAAGARPVLPMAAAAGVLGLALAAIVAWVLWPAVVPGPVARFSFPLVANEELLPNFIPTVGISRDGTRVAYAAQGGIYIRDIDDTESRLLPGSGGPSAVGRSVPTFSPDGSSLAFVNVDAPADMQLKVMPVSGGSPITLAEGAMVGLSWSGDGTLLFGGLVAGQSGILRLPETGGEPELLVPAAEGEALYYPQLLPGGRRVLFTVLDQSTTPPVSQVAVQSIGADDRNVLRNGASAGRYVDTGHLAYLQGTTLFAVPFDPEASAVGGGAVPLVEGVRGTQTGGAHYAISDTGTLVSITGGGIEAGATVLPRTTPVWVSREGTEEPLPIREDDYTAVRISPDGTKVALATGSIADGRAPAIWIYDQGTENLSLLTTGGPGDQPVWAPDSRRLFYRDLAETQGIFVVDVETRDSERVASFDPDYALPPSPVSLSPDERMLAVIQGITINDTDVVILDLTNGEYTALIKGPGNQSTGGISPDGAWLAYFDNTLGDPGEVNVVPFPDVTRRRIPVGVGRYPVFSRDGRELFFDDGRGLSVVSVELEPVFRIVGTPTRLFQGDYLWVSWGRPWDTHPDGQRVLMILPPEVPIDSRSEAAETVTPQIDVVLNWVEELKARVPVN